jgi:hypothetical protein
MSIGDRQNQAAAGSGMKENYSNRREGPQKLNIIDQSASLS